MWSGLGNPTVLRFAPDGRVFVASKSGLVNVYDSLSDTTATQYADLRSKVHDYWDRGMLGLAVDPEFDSGRPYVYVLYAYDSRGWNDGCPSPPGPTANGCEVSGRLSRLGPGGTETVLIDDFCQQYPSHSIGTIDFGPDGMLYLSAGDGASFTFADYGQVANSCGDPAGDGGALRSQSFNRTGGQPVSLDGTILRVNPDTGDAAAGNPAIGDPNPNRRRIVAHGLRNPFRFTFRPGTGEIWSGDVGWNSFEEINRTPNISEVRNYGWPCYEGLGRMSSYDTLDLGSCERLYSSGTATAPYFSYQHGAPVVAGESCPNGSSSISGLAFYTGDAFGPEYRDALFFSDYSRNCIWVMFKGANGLPDTATRRVFLAGADGPVFLTQGPDGALYYADLTGGTIRRIASNNTAPTARITANPTSGAAPLTVAFDGRDSSDPQQQTLTYAWDLDGDGAYDDSTQVAPSYTYTSAGTVTVRLRVTDPGGLTGTTSTTITVGGVPVATIDAPSTTTTWAVGDTIAFAGSARTSSGAALPASRLTWTLSLRHCSRTDSNVCHTHAIQDYAGVASGSFVAPDHEYPSHLLLSLRATDPNGLTDTETVRLDPRTAEVALRSSPVGLRLSFASETVATPFTRTVLARSVTSVAAASPQWLGADLYQWDAWSDGGARTHAVTAPASGTATYTATFASAATGDINLAGVDVVGDHTSSAPAGTGGAYRVVAGRTGTARSVRLYVDATSAAGELVLALYDERANGEPGALLGAGSVDGPLAGAWNFVSLDRDVALVAGKPYWIGLLNPAGSGGTLTWRDRVDYLWTAERVSLSTTLTALPPWWESRESWWDGPLSASAWGVPGAAATPTPTPTPTPNSTSTPTPEPEPYVVPAAPPAPPVVQPTQPRGPVASWSFDDRRARGRVGRALEITNRSVAVGVPKLTGAFTVEAWVRPARSGVVATSTGWALRLDRATVGNATARGTAAKAGRWTHLAFTYDGRTIRRYVNGRLAGTRKRSGKLSTGTVVRLGTGGFRGRIDELRVYDRALPAAQLKR